MLFCTQKQISKLILKISDKQIGTNPESKFILASDLILKKCIKGLINYVVWVKFQHLNEYFESELGF